MCVCWWKTWGREEDLIEAEDAEDAEEEEEEEEKEDERCCETTGPVT